MRFGITMFPTDRSIGIVELAREAEARGLDSLWLPEHTHIPASRESPWPAGGDLPEEYWRCLDPIVAMTAAVMVTERLRVGTGILLAAQREPIANAKAVATLDHLSGGRVTLGVGYGWNREEMGHHGVAYSERRDVVREHVMAMQALWREDEGEFHGRYVDFSPSRSWPKPAQRDGAGRPAVPVLVGGGAGPKLFAQVVEYADGWMPIGGAGMSTDLPRLRDQWEAAGRDPSSLQVVPFATLPSVGKLDHYAELGVTEVVAQVPSAGRDKVLAWIDHIVGVIDDHRGSGGSGGAP
jgi:probable F420-dependent oxidoreductase